MSESSNDLAKAYESAKKSIGDLADRVGDKLRDIAMSMTEYSIAAPFKNDRANKIKMDEQISGGVTANAPERPAETPSNYSDPKTGKIGFFK